MLKIVQAQSAKAYVGAFDSLNHDSLATDYDLVNYVARIGEAQKLLITYLHFQSLKFVTVVRHSLIESVIKKGGKMNVINNKPFNCNFIIILTW